MDLLHQGCINANYIFRAILQNPNSRNKRAIKALPATIK